MATGQVQPETRCVIQEPGNLRKKNQITLPKSVAGALRVRPGDRVLFVVDDAEPGAVRLYRMPKSFAGIAPHAYGGETSSAAYVRSEREAWEE
jgi:bifunctional DNA-binding transcriptional regulator/antitoxin component of YhaV-PrlF toxin-antitoxin module